MPRYTLQSATQGCGITNPMAFDPDNSIDCRVLGNNIAAILSLPEVNRARGFGNSIPQIIVEMQNMIKVGADGQMQFMAPSDSFAASYKRMSKHKKQLQFMATQDTYVEYLNNLFAIFGDVVMFDRGYERIYDIRPLNGTDTYEIMETHHENSLNKIEPGGSIYYSGSRAVKYSVKADYYGGGIAVDQRLIDTRNFYQIERDIRAAIAFYNRREAQIYYALVEAIAYAGDYEVAWQMPTPIGLPNTDAQYVINRDWQTIQTAKNVLIAANKNRPDILTAGKNTQLGILCDTEYEDRLGEALKYALNDFNTGTRESGRFFIESTTELVVPTKYHVFIPNGENTGGKMFDLRSYDAFNKDNLTNERANWKALSGNIGQIEQFCRCAYA